MYRTKLYSLVILLAAATLAGCGSDDAGVSNPSDDLFDQQQQTIEQYLTERNIATQENAAGIHYQVLTENTTGTEPAPGNIVNLFYHIEQLTGGVVATLEDSSGLDPVTYTFGSNTLLLPSGLNEIVSLMREGEEYEFYLPSKWAYLDYSQGSTIPANAIVRARIHLADVFTEEEQKQAEDARIQEYIATNQIQQAKRLASGTYYAPTQAGDSSEAVTANRVVGIRYTGSLLDGTVFDKNTEADDKLLEFSVQEGKVIDGFLAGVQQMSLGEKGVVLIPSHEAYGQGLMAIPYSIVGSLLDRRDLDPQVYGFTRLIAPYSILRFDIEVVTIN